MGTSLKETLQIAVRELVEWVLRSGDLDLTFSAGSKTTDAIRAHQKIQRSRPPGYEAEVRISRQIETDHFFLGVSGRIDGVYTLSEATDGAKVIIDEIKTTTRDLAVFQESDHPIHWGQAKVYAYLYAVTYEIDPIDIQLTYYRIDTEERVEIRRRFDLSTLSAFFADLVDRYAAWANVLSSWCNTRDEHIEALSFPFADYRPGQREMAIHVFRVIQNHSQLFVQAPTGIGKTVATLFPSIKALGRGLTAKVFYLTARTTARAVAEKAIHGMGKNGLRIKSITLTAKDKICFCPDAVCHPDECIFAKGYFDHIDAAVFELFTHADRFTREAIEKAARDFQICPFEFSLELTLWADIIICDYNYAFDPRVYLRRFFSDDQGNYTFLVDEAHNLVDRSREMFSAEIRKQPFLDLRKSLKDALPGLYKTLGKINSQLVKSRSTCEESGGRMAQAQAPYELSPLLASFQFQAERWLLKNKPAPFREPLLSLYFEVGTFLKILDGYTDNYATCMEKIGLDLKIKLFCVDPADQMAAALARGRSIVFFSATLTPIAYFKKLFGCNDNAYGFSLPSPFPRENFCLLSLNRLSTRYQSRETTLPALLEILHTLVSTGRGNHLLFFPSYQYMMMTYTAFIAAFPEIEIVLQTPEMGESDRAAFLEKFTHENDPRLVGFAVIGGVFGEGIDLEGDRLSGAAIIGVGLPGISIENELIREHFDRRNGVGFDYAYLYPGINRVFQAAGRVIRSETDRGVVLLIDDRYATPRYRRLLPEHWEPIPVRDEKELEKHLNRFWEGRSDE
jgi:DNA excision repair protein ERCC-2